MGASVAVQEFKSEAEMRAHYAALHRKTFAPRTVAVVAAPLKIEQPSVQVGEADNQAAPKPAVPRPVYLSTAQREGRAEVSGQQVLCCVSQVTGHIQRSIKSPERTQQVVRARQIAAWLLVYRAGKSLPEAGRFLGGRDHTTILHSCRRVTSAFEALGGVPEGDIEVLARTLWSVAWPRLKKADWRSLKCD